MKTNYAVRIALTLAAAALIGGCGDDTGAGGTGGSGGTGGTAGRDAAADRMLDAPMIDAPMIDAAIDAEPDAMPDAMSICPSPIRALSATDSYDGTLMGMSLNPSTSCQTGARGPENVFTFTVPTRTGLVFSTEATRTTIDTILEVRRNCDDPGSAVACDDDGGRGTTSYLREVFEPGDYLLLVDQYSTTMAMGGPYNLAVSSFTPAANATCATATSLMAGTPLTGQSSVDGGSIETPCPGGTTGAQVFYSLTIPGGQRATITATPTGTPAWAPTVRVLSGCTMTQCLGNTNGTSGMPTVRSVDNPGSSPRTVIVTVSGASPTTGGTFDLAATLAMLPYTESQVATACDDMTAGTVLTLTPSDMDDAASAIAALPFAFQLAGAAVTHYSATSNGFAQLWPDMTGTPSTEFLNASIPTAANPNGFVAPFWDDLVPVMGGNTDLRVATFGTAPNQHFTIQWSNWTTFGASSTRLTFQVKLFETTNVIELHYCTLTPGTGGGRVTGSSATVGIESLTGSNGIQHAFNTAMSVSTANALRFTPQ